MDELEVLARQFRRHTMRRRHGTPTITVLLGDVASRLTQLEHFFEGCAHHLVVASHAPYASLAEAWVRAVTSTCDLTRRALHTASAGRDDLHASYAALSGRERTLFLERLADEASRFEARAAAEWLVRYASADHTTGDGREALRALNAWLNASDWPALCVTVDEPFGLEELASLCALAPALPLVAIVPSTVWREGLASVCPRVRALLLDGVIESAAPSGLSGASRTVQETPLPRPPVDSLAWLREQARAALIVAEQVGDQADVEAQRAEARARSMAELLLHELLEAEVRTRGLFTLAEQAGRTLERDAELALVAREPAIAITVDVGRRAPSHGAAEGRWWMRVFAHDVIERGHEVVRSVSELVAEQLAARTARRAL